MKRSPLHRYKALHRRTPLRRVSLKRMEAFSAYRDALAAVSGRRYCHGWYCWPWIACSGRLDPHHVKPRGRYPEAVADPDNIVYVCRRHHDQIHNIDPARARSFGLLKG